jgi:hypothetical protein
VKRFSGTAKDLARLMRARGYILVRANRHCVWEHPTSGARVTTAVSPSDRRALDNARTSIRKAEREAGARATQPEEPPNHLRR